MIFLKIFCLFLIYYFQHIEMYQTAEPPRDSDTEQNSAEVAAISASVPPPDTVDKSTNTDLSVRN